MLRVDWQFSHCRHTRPNLRKVLGGEDRFHPRHGRGGRGVDRFDSGVSVRAAQDLAVQEAGQTDIGTILGPTGDLIDPIVPNRTRPDDLEFMFLLGCHVYLPCISAAASCTALTILS